MPTLRTLHLLMIEHRPDYQPRLQYVLQKNGFPATFAQASDISDAMRYLRKEGISHDSLRPDLILLDAQLPEGAIAALSAIKNSVALHAIPVLMLSGVDQAEGLQDAYLSGVAGYWVVPAEDEAFEVAAVQFANYWWRAVRLPENLDE